MVNKQQKPEEPETIPPIIIINGNVQICTEKSCLQLPPSWEWTWGLIIIFLARNIKKYPDLHRKVIFHNPVKGVAKKVCTTPVKGVEWSCVQPPLKKILMGII